MPLEKTYNVSTLTQDVSGYDASIVTQVLSVGADYKKSNNNLYLARDIDTVALPLISRDADSLSFAWQFRPVFQRTIIDPGTRQVFAVLSLPADSSNDMTSSGDINLDVTVKTYWRRYDVKRRMAKGTIQGSNINETFRVEVPNQRKIRDEMAAQIISVEPFDMGNGQVLTHVRGFNFLPGTTIAIGGTTYTDGDQLKINSEQISLSLPRRPNSCRLTP